MKSNVIIIWSRYFQTKKDKKEEDKKEIGEMSDVFGAAPKQPEPAQYHPLMYNPGGMTMGTIDTTVVAYQPNLLPALIPLQPFSSNSNLPKQW